MSMMAERAAPKFLEWSEASQTWTKMRGRLIILGGQVPCTVGKAGYTQELVELCGSCCAHGSREFLCVASLCGYVK